MITERSDRNCAIESPLCVSRLDSEAMCKSASSVFPLWSRDRPLAGRPAPARSDSGRCWACSADISMGTAKWASNRTTDRAPCRFVGCTVPYRSSRCSAWSFCEATERKDLVSLWLAFNWTIYTEFYGIQLTFDSKPPCHWNRFHGKTVWTSHLVRGSRGWTWKFALCIPIRRWGGKERAQSTKAIDFWTFSNFRSLKFKVWRLRVCLKTIWRGIHQECRKQIKLAL